MIKPTTLARPFWVLLVIFTLIRLVASFQGVPYENTRVASISLLNLGFLAGALTAALARGLGGLSLKGAAQTGALIGFSVQATILTLTLLSAALGLNTYFNYGPAMDPALTGHQLEIMTALRFRGLGLVIGPVLGALMGSIGWLIGGTMTLRKESERPSAIRSSTAS